jgi:hypothetical protein
VNVNVYLPDDLGEHAKAEELKLSRLLREAVVNELHRRKTMRETLEEPQVYEIEIGDDVHIDGESVEERGTYLGRITGKLVHETPIWLVFLATDRRVIVYYGGDDARHDLRYYVLEADATEQQLIEFLRKHIDIDFEFAGACRALGVRPVIDL